MIKLGFSGRKTAGKDFFAGKIHREMSLTGNNVTVLHFATPLKDLASALVADDLKLVANWIAVYLTASHWQHHRARRKITRILTNIKKHCPDYLETENGKHRKLYQYLGTDLFRKVDEDIWVDIMSRRIRDLKGHQDSIILIPDVRFPNEVEFCDYVVRVEGGVSGDKHISENHILRYHYVIANEPRLSEEMVGVHVKKICKKFLTNDC